MMVYSHCCDYNFDYFPSTKAKSTQSTIRWNGARGEYTFMNPSQGDLNPRD